MRKCENVIFDLVKTVKAEYLSSKLYNTVYIDYLISVKLPIK